MIYKLLCFLSFILSIAHSYSIFYRNQTNYHFLTLSGDASTLLLIKMRQDSNVVFTYNRREGSELKQWKRSGGSAAFHTYFPESDVQYSAKYGMNKPQLSRNGKLIYFVTKHENRFKLRMVQFINEQNDKIIRSINMHQFRQSSKYLNFALGNNYLIQYNNNYFSSDMLIYEIQQQYPYRNVYRNKLNKYQYIKYMKIAQERQRMFILFDNGNLSFYQDILDSQIQRTATNVENAVFISNSYLLLSLNDDTLSIMKTNGQITPLNLGFNHKKNNFVVSSKYTHVGFVQKEENHRLSNLQVFNLFKIKDLLYENLQNKTIFPTLRIIEVGTFLSIDVNEDASIISYIRSYGDEPTRELVFVERTPGVKQTIYPCYDQFYQQMYPELCGVLPQWLKILIIVLGFIFLAIMIALIVAGIILRKGIKNIIEHLPQEEAKSEQVIHNGE